MHVAPSIQLNPLLLACLEDSSNVLARFAYKQPLVLQIGKIDLFSAMPTYADPSRGDARRHHHDHHVQSLLLCLLLPPFCTKEDAGNLHRSIQTFSISLSSSSWINL